MLKSLRCVKIFLNHYRLAFIPSTLSCGIDSGPDTIHQTQHSSPLNKPSIFFTHYFVVNKQNSICSVHPEATFCVRFFSKQSDFFTRGSYPPTRTAVESWRWNGTGMCAACYMGDAVCERRVHRVAVAARAGADDGGLVEFFGTFSLTISESKTETICMLIPRAPTAKIVFNATGQQYRQTTSFTYLGGTVTKTPNLSDEIDQRVRVGWMGFKRYKRELYDRPKASLLPLKARMVTSEVVEALLYGCATLTPLKGHYAKLCTTHHRMLLRILGTCCKSPYKRILSYKDALRQIECKSIETTVRTRRLFVGEGAALHG